MMYEQPVGIRTALGPTGIQLANMSAITLESSNFDPLARISILMEQRLLSIAKRKVA
jgi:hypothetical protein